ncbi:MAG: hypothetical protein HQL60_06130 [Magnetococcales bacterium]|nr:hypothetical protein [Magnetococcales bacterium]
MNTIMSTITAVLSFQKRFNSLLYRVRWGLFRCHYSLFHLLRGRFPGLGLYLMPSLDRMHNRLVTMPEYWGNTD